MFFYQGNQIMKFYHTNDSYYSCSPSSYSPPSYSPSVGSDIFSAMLLSAKLSFHNFTHSLTLSLQYVLANKAASENLLDFINTSTHLYFSPVR